MKVLSKQAHEKARQFIEQSGRPLEGALYAWYFQDGPIESVYEALATFQNADGGFGHGLESDIRLPDSSVIATTLGLQVLREIHAPVSHPLVLGAMRYLTDTYDPDIQAWEIVPANIDDAPHAPWWGYDADIASRWGGFLFNPRAEIIGYLYDYAERVPAGVAENLTKAVEKHLRDAADTVGEMDLICGIRLAQTENLPSAQRKRLISLLRPLVNRLVEHRAEAWSHYSLRPLEIAPTPDSPFADLLAGDVAANLDYLIETQQEDGSWLPTWTWGDLYPETWPHARQEWSGVLTLRALVALRAYGWLEL